MITHPERYCKDLEHECHTDAAYHEQQTGAPTSDHAAGRVTTGPLALTDADLQTLLNSFTSADPADEDVFAIQEGR